MKKQFSALIGFVFAMSVLMTGSGAVSSSRVSSPSEEVGNTSALAVSELEVQFGDNGETFAMHLEDNSTSAAIAGYVGTTDWRLPVYTAMMNPM